MKHEQAYDRKLATRIVLLYAGAMLILFVALGLLVRRAVRGYFRQLLEAAKTGKARIGGTTALIRDIAEKSEGLLDTNAAIQAIAGQVNLPAMNAAIEAERAFDHVAELIQTLNELERQIQHAMEDGNRGCGDQPRCSHRH